MIHDGKRPNKLELAVQRELLVTEGRLDALRFTVACGFDPSRITAELAERESIIESLLSMNPSPMAPGAGPRVYRDAYVNTLHETLELIRSETEDAV
ncbi:MAG: hypothetical protein WAW20_04880 [Anaerolineae bacterium]